MSDKFILSAERIQNGYLVRGPEYTMFFSFADAAKANAKLKEHADEVFKEFTTPAEKK